MEQEGKVQVVVELGSTGEYKDGVYTGECYLTFPAYSMLSVIVPDMSNQAEAAELVERGIAWHEEHYADLKPFGEEVSTSVMFNRSTRSFSYLPE